MLRPWITAVSILSKLRGCNVTLDMSLLSPRIRRNLMELTYTVRGADGKEYGPVTTEQITTLDS